MELKDIVTKYLKENGYAGLCHPGECGCGIDDLMPCTEIYPTCRAAYKCEHPKCDHDPDLEPLYCVKNPATCEHLKGANDEL